MMSLRSKAISARKRRIAGAGYSTDGDERIHAFILGHLARRIRRPGVGSLTTPDCGQESPDRRDRPSAPWHYPRYQRVRRAGHDVIGVLKSHPRKSEVHALLVESDDDNVRVARARIAAAGICGVDVRQADAGNTGTYRDAIPADVLMLCGIFGNVNDEDVLRTVNNASRLCTPQATVLWTNQRRDPDRTDRYGRGSPKPGTRNSRSTHPGLIGSPSGHFGWRLRHSLTGLICVSSRSGRNEGDAGNARPLAPHPGKLAGQGRPWIEASPNLCTSDRGRPDY